MVRTLAAAVATILLLALPIGCRSGVDRGGFSPDPTSKPPRRGDGPGVRNVVCLFDQRPWLNADAAADRDPEGIQYRVFLDTGQGKAKFREGTFHVEMYQVGRDADGKPTRTLVSDWHYPSSSFAQVRANVLGEGYRLQLYWAKKDLAGNEIEIVTKFEDPWGTVSRSDTRRLRIPKYSA